MSNKFELSKKSSPNPLLKYVVYSIVITITFFFGNILGYSISSIKYSPNSKIKDVLLSSVKDVKKYTIDGDIKVIVDSEEIDFTLYNDVFNELQSNYINTDSFQEDKILYESIKGMVDSLGDEHTIFLTPEETKQFEEISSGKYSGIGAEVAEKNGKIVVVTPLKGSPAEKNGIKPEDVIVKVDDKDVQGLSITEVVALIKGEKGSIVKLQVNRDEQIIEFNIVREEIKYSTMYYEVKDNIGYLEINRFIDVNPTLWNSRWEEIIKEIDDSKVDKLIIDLRGNGGGYLNSVIYALNDIVEKDKVIMKVEGRNGVIESTYISSGVGRLADKEIVILINQGSASASEIFAGVLQQTNNVKIIGENSFGKGSVQDIITFKNGSSIHVTIQKWLLPDGRNIDKNNPIIPDYVIEYTKEQYNQGIDPQYDYAKQILTNN